MKQVRSLITLKENYVKFKNKIKLKKKRMKNPKKKKKENFKRRLWVKKLRARSYPVKSSF